jgi:excisionase family DNA binding protein
MSSNIRLPKICEFCNKEFIAKTTVTKYCGDACAKRGYKRDKREKKIAKAKPVDKQKLEIRLEHIKIKDFISIQEACKYLGVSRMTIYRQIKSGNIKAGKIGRRTIIDKSSILNLMAQ